MQDTLRAQHSAELAALTSLLQEEHSALLDHPHQLALAAETLRKQQQEVFDQQAFAQEEQRMRLLKEAHGLELTLRDEALGELEVSDNSHTHTHTHYLTHSHTYTLTQIHPSIPS